MLSAAGLHHMYTCMCGSETAQWCEAPQSHIKACAHHRATAGLRPGCSLYRDRENYLRSLRAWQARSGNAEHTGRVCAHLKVAGWWSVARAALQPHSTSTKATAGLPPSPAGGLVFEQGATLGHPVQQAEGKTW